MNGIIEVYHAGIEEVRCPDTLHSRTQLDFGKGFYITDVYEQATNWAIRRAKKFGNLPVLNKYLLHRKELLVKDGVRVKIFDDYDEEWLDFVVGNRRGDCLWESFDYIEGGVADDRVVDTIDLYMSGYISRTEAIDRLKYLKPNNQICITNQELLDEFLKFTDSIILAES